jgi:hypothetical protein
MILGLELNLTSSYDFSKVISCCKEFVATYGRFIPLIVQFLKVGNLFGSKQDTYRKVHNAWTHWRCELGVLGQSAVQVLRTWNNEDFEEERDRQVSS